MGRELQKKKNRSGVSKVRMKPKSKKAQLVKNPIIAANWDKSQTLEQNYKRLGLATRLNKTTGGVEKKADDIARRREAGEDGEADRDQRGDPLRIVGRKKSETLNITEAKVERDPVTGKILRVLDSGNAKPNPLNDPLNDLDSDDEEEEWNGFNEHATNTEGKAAGKSKGADTETVKQLEKEASHPRVKWRPRQTEGEKAFISELVAKYGDDYAKMARDIKINYMQRSEGDLKRRVKKWREEGGTV